MKELLLKLRHWMITKLGGYTRQQVIIQKMNTIVVKNRCIPFVAEIHMDTYFDMDRSREEDMYKYVKMQLCEQIARLILEQGFIKVDCKENVDDFYPMRDYRGIVYLVPPNEAEKINALMTDWPCTAGRPGGKK